MAPKTTAGNGSRWRVGDSFCLATSALLARGKEPGPLRENSGTQCFTAASVFEASPAEIPLKKSSSERRTSVWSSSRSVCHSRWCSWHHATNCFARL